MSPQQFNLDDFTGASEITVRKGHCLAYEGDAGDHLAYYIVSGSVEVASECIDGSRILFYKLHPGELFGELALMGVNERTASIYASEKTTLLKINATVWEKSMQAPQFVKKVYQLLLNRYLETTKVVNRLGQSTVLQRLGTYLITLPEWRQHSGDHIILTLPSHAQMANMLNCTRERISAMMSQLHKSGAIQKNTDNGTVKLSYSRIKGVLLGSSKG